VHQLVTSISSALRQQLVIADAQFDRLFPPSQRIRSGVHWTPVEIAIRAASLLAPDPGRRVLDVGAGVGKLCLVGALTTQSRFTGIEKDSRMIEVARRAAGKLGVGDQVEFRHGDATSFDWSAFDSIYLYNPFTEMLIDPKLDALMRRDRYGEYLQRAQQRLVETKPGTRVVTYHGFGGEMPDGFALVERQPAGLDELCLWLRVPPS
jgi:SAM-dependent methyltransferase